jgi:CRISPR system Cascade subunit CasA
MNLLTDALLTVECGGEQFSCSLPEVFARLMADEVDCFPALRAHQEPAWHMFLAQLGAIALHRAGRSEPPTDAETWGVAIRALTEKAFPVDEPWRLVVDDWTKPAFLQPPVPEGMSLKEGEPIWTPDALDMLITARNHDLKQSVAIEVGAEVWLFALISLQTMEGYGGGGGGLRGIARMNGGSSSRVMMGLAPLSLEAGHDVLRPGPRLRRDIEQLLARRDDLMARFCIGYKPTGGVALTWTERWPNDRQLELQDLDIWFIEVCRRVRLRREGAHLQAVTGLSASERIRAKHLAGVVGDPWAPVDRVERKSLTIGVGGEFDYKLLKDLLLGADWELPPLLELGSTEGTPTTTWSLVTKAIARGNSKTDGFKERIIPITGRAARGLGRQRQELHQLAQAQIKDIETLDKILRNALALTCAGGEFDDIDEAAYARTRPPRARLDAVADRLFFPALWERFEAEQSGDLAARIAAENRFRQALVDVARDLLEEALDDIPCRAIHRPRAQARARRLFEAQLRSANGFPGLFLNATPEEEGTSDVRHQSAG